MKQHIGFVLLLALPVYAVAERPPPDPSIPGARFHSR